MNVVNTTELKNLSIDALTGYELAEIREKGVINGDLNRDLAVVLFAKYFNNGSLPDDRQLELLDSVIQDVQCNIDDNADLANGVTILRDQAKALMVVSLLT